MNIDKIITLVCAIIINHKEEILILKRSNNNRHYIGHWQLPEGKIKKDESPSEAMSRELFEEIGLRAIITNLKTILAIKISVKQSDILLIKPVFLLDASPKIILGKDHSEYKWLARKQAFKSNLSFVPGTKEVFEMIWK